MEITKRTEEMVSDLLEIADAARRQLDIAQITAAHLLGIDDENEWLRDCFAGGSDMEKLLAMTNTTVRG